MLWNWFRPARSTAKSRPQTRLRLEPLEDRAVPATLPTGFTESAVATGLTNASAMEFAPNGDLWVLEQGGAVKRFQSGSTTADIVGKVNGLGLSSSGERGLLGIAFDPNYSTNKWVYLYYTATSPNIHNRISRFTVNTSDATDYYLAGTSTTPADAGSSGTPTQTIIFDLSPLSSATNHNGGAIHFGPDGKLYAAVGDNATGSNAQTLNNLHGKMLRLNKDGTIPTDNPFYNTATGKNRAIWALGLRNPFTFTFQPGTGRMFINDVGQNAWEEINEGSAGANYNWPGTEGDFTPPSPNPNGLTRPFYAYPHSGGPVTGFAITGGAFYDPATNQYPAEYAGDYFFADYVSSWVKRIDTTTGEVSSFASGASNPVDLRVSADGSLYYLSRGEGKAYRVQYTNSEAPIVTQSPASQTISAGQPVTFSVTASGAAPLSYQWQRDGVDIAGATSSTYTIAAVSAADDGAQFRTVVSNSLGSAASAAATLTVTANQAPTATITLPSAGALFRAGVPVQFAGSANDPEDGALPASAFTWEINYITSINSGTPVVRPFVGPTGGITGGTFTPATVSPYTLPDVAYRVTLTVTDSAGLKHTVTRDIFPEVATLTVQANVAGLQLTVDGQPHAGPYTYESVVGLVRPVGAPSPQTVGGTAYVFASWSDGGAAAHDVATPASDTTYTATFVVAPTGSFQQSHAANGLVVIEAENYHANVTPAGADAWVLKAIAGASGGSALQALPDNGTNNNANYVTASPRLDFKVNFVKTGTHYVWVRGRAVAGQEINSDSLHVGLDGQAVSSADRLEGFTSAFGWSKQTMDGVVATINVTTLGEHTINVWMREDGFTFDKLLLTTDANYAPTGAGPAESTRAVPVIDFTGKTVTAYGSGQDGENGLPTSAQVLDGGATLKLSGNAWKKIAFDYTVTANTVLEFDFLSTDGGEIHGIGMDNDNNHANARRAFQVFGSQVWGGNPNGAFQDYKNYTGSGWKRYVIPVGQFYTGVMSHLFFINDDDAAGAADSFFRNVRVYEG